MAAIDDIAAQIKAMKPADQLRLAAELLDNAEARPDLVVKVATPIVRSIADELALVALRRSFK